MRKLFFLASLVFLLSACGKGVDDEVLESLSTALESRWDYTDTLPKEVTVEELSKAVEIELNNLNDYEYTDYKDGDLFLLYEKYKNELNHIQIIMNGKSTDDPFFQLDWEEHMKNRKITLYEINRLHNINVSDKRKEILEELISEGELLFEQQKNNPESLSHKEVMSHLLGMTSKYSMAYTTGISSDEKLRYLNEAITDINLEMIEIEDKYDDGTPPTNKLLQLADTLLLSIDMEFTGDRQGAYEQAVNAGEIIGELSKEYLNGELPIGIKNMTGIENTNE